MEKIYNVQTGLPEELTLDKIPQALQSGTHAFKKGTRVDVLDPNGESYSLDVAELNDAVANGWKLESDDDKAIRQAVKDNEGFIGGLKVGVAQAVDEALLGIPETIYDETADPLDVAKKDAIKKSHSTFNALGGTAGFLSSFANPTTAAGRIALPTTQLIKGATKVGGLVEKEVAGAVGKTLGEGVIAKAAPKIAGSTVEGVAFTAPIAITEGMLGDPDKAAETLLAGGLFGGVLGGAVEATKPLLKLGRDKAENFLKIKTFDEDSALNALNLTPAQRVKLQDTAPDVIEKLPEFLRGITKDDSSLLFDAKKLSQKISEQKAMAGKGIGKVIDDADVMIKDKMKFGDDVTKAEIENLGYNYQSLESKLDDLVAPYKDDPRYAGFVNEVRTEIDSLNKLMQSNGIAAKSPDIKFLREFQNRTSNLVNYDKAANRVDLASDARKLIVKDIQNYLKNDLPKLVAKVDPSMKAQAEQLKQFNDTFRVATTIEKLAKRAASKEQAAPFLGFRDLLAGATGGSVGGLLGAAIGVGAKRIMDYGKRAYEVGGILVANDKIKTVAKKMESIPAALKSYEKPAKAKAVLSLASITGNKEDDNFDKLSEKLYGFANNPQSAELTEALDAMGETGSPKVAELAKIKAVEAVKYLLEVIPKPLTPNNPLVKGKTYKPSDMEMMRFKRQVKTALDPFSAIDDLNNNTLTVEQVEVLANVYPQILADIQFQVQSAVQDNPTAIPYNKRIKLSLLLGMDLDPSLNPETAAIIMTSPAQTLPEEQQKGVPNAKFTTYPSEVQRIENDLK